MRIRKEVSTWSLKIFLILLISLLIIYNLFYLLAGYFQETEFFSNNYFWTWILLAIFNPLVLSMILTTVFRTSSLFITDYENIEGFQDKLKTIVLSRNLKIELELEKVVVFTPTNWFFKLFNAWFETEKLTIQWEREIIIHGPLKKISALEDALTFDTALKS
jgi:predicted permease